MEGKDNMGDVMKQIPFGEMMNRVLMEYDMYKEIYSIKSHYVSPQTQSSTLFGHKLENPVGPAAGPHTQLAQNLIASYISGGRFMELKTVQILDGDELHVDKPCIRADDECYNVEWSSELYIQEALEEYVKGWFGCKLVAKEFGLGDPDGFIFNMSVGYNLEGIKSAKVDGFIEGMKDASITPYFEQCRKWALDNVDRFKNVDAEFINSISPYMVNSMTLSTMHGCPADEIEAIVSYLIEEKSINTYLKCNPTLLGYDFVRTILDDMGYDYMVFGHEGFDNDLQFDDAVEMIKRLQALAKKNNSEFGVKLSNTFQVKASRNELPGEAMYMSGKALYPLTINLAAKISRAFDGKLPISYSGGADINNIEAIYSAGVWPITVSTILLKPNGYTRLKQLAEKLDESTFTSEKLVNTEILEALAEEVRTNPFYVKSEKSRATAENLVDFNENRRDGIDCRVVCGSCVNVCPNRANIVIKTSEKKYLLHIDDYCNECGNCYIFCPDPASPFQDKFTLFIDEKNMDESENEGFTLLGANVKYRYAGVEEVCALEDAPEVVRAFATSLALEHPYLIQE